MTEDEYPAYLEYFVQDYANEIESNYRVSQPDSLARAKQELSALLPEGVNTAGQVLLCIIAQSAHVGYLWYKPDPVMRTAFIYDFHILTACQGMGLGK